jgi:hypothetical protein
MSQGEKTLAGFAGLVISIIGGVISNELRFTPGEFLSVLGGILFIVGVYRSAFSSSSESTASQNAATQALESRMTDVQEIILSLDERLKRLEEQNQPTNETSL